MGIVYFVRLHSLFTASMKAMQLCVSRSPPISRIAVKFSMDWSKCPQMMTIAFMNKFKRPGPMVSQLERMPSGRYVKYASAKYTCMLRSPIIKYTNQLTESLPWTLFVSRFLKQATIVL